MSRLEATAGFTFIDADGYKQATEHWIVGLNLYMSRRYNSKLQFSHRWISNSRGVESDDFSEVRLQLQYVW